MRYLLRWPIQVWLATVIAIVIVIVASLMISQTSTVNAAPESNLPLDCLSCHTRTLTSHDKLGSGSEACWACHDSNNIGKLTLFDGTQLPLADSAQVCGQCHRGRYEAWKEGSHGMPIEREHAPGVFDAEKMKCIDCHNPHQPKMELSRIISPYPPPESGEEGPLYCLSCHVRVLEAHDKLGEGNEACWSCHSNRIMGELHLAEGQEKLILADYLRLCAQCHQNRYEEWVEGTHGAPAWKEGSVEIHGAGKVGCIGCHDPHQPQVVLLNITKPHPLPAPPPPPPPVEPLIMLGISLLVIIALGVAVATRGEGP